MGPDASPGRAAKDPGPGPAPAAGSDLFPPHAVIRLLTCAEPQSLLHTAMRIGVAGVDAVSGVICLVQDDGWLRPTAAVNYSDKILDRFRLIPPDSPLPAARAVRERRAVYQAAEELSEAFPDIRALRAPEINFAAIPLLVDDRCLGSIVLRIDRPWPPGSEWSLALSAVAAVCAHRLEHLLSVGVDSVPGGGLDMAVELLENRARTARLELAMSGAETGAFDWDFASGRLVWDERLCRLFGMRPEDFDEKDATYYNAIHPDDRAVVNRAVRESRRTGGDYRATYRIVRPDGRVRRLDARGRVFRDMTGRPARMVGIAQDVTEEWERKEREDHRKNLVLEVTGALSDAISVSDVVTAMTRTMLPALGADAVVLYVEEDGHLWPAGVQGHPEEATRRMSAAAAFPGSPVRRALEEGRPLFYENRAAYLADFPEEVFSPGEHHHSWVVLPLIAAHRVVGGCVISHTAPHRFSPDDRTLVAALAGILTQAMERARLFDQRRWQMTELQRVMLPRHLPVLPDLAVAARYLPASRGMEVGGDWYDLLPLPSGRVGVVIGDVQGHSATAAAVMGQLRTALRAYTAEGHDPATLMEHSNRLLCELDTDLFATCCYAEIDPVDGTVEMVRAGHPVPLRLDAEGRAAEKNVPGGVPLGLDPGSEYPVHRAELPPGEALLLFTDGLVENRGGDYAENVARLADRVSRWNATRGSRYNDVIADARRELELLADEIVAPPGDRTPREDDVAVLLVRRCPDSRNPTTCSARWHAAGGNLAEVHEVRRALGRQVRAWGLRERAADTELLAAELLSNAALHADGDIDLTARLEDGTLRVEVFDTNHYRPRVVPVDEETGEAAEPGVSGRGMHLVQEWADRWGWEPRGDRKAVWFEVTEKYPAPRRP
ncbi:SpoIIE family protein phosphatase [Streptomyces sp. SCUT-3]|uniref:SpoIIE family protein phosphatase n=1 Tax=Streptomyces sp. SCUT-3 TaxID=2684469 RepID=UPI000CB5C7ED|nr:SpoIIE family protein phosphatase [Streptomyces sp. SCUT-3]PLW72428.1 PAS domain S-box protein [Streptomyces sp. DJ]QMV24296.1 SpoIIE family protein phosphatase [Streptomyces sp. SCUT-3]